jgi:hypothetical protein
MKKIITIILASLFSLTALASNEVYIEQVGDGSTITITQDGSDNKVGTSLSPFYIGGDSTTVIIDQVGSTNLLTGVINGTATDVTVTTIGSNNTQEMNCGSTIVSSCNGSWISQIITGDNNIITQNLGAGSNHTSGIIVTGDTNTITHTSTNTGAVEVNINVNGSTNNIGVTQSGMLAKTVTVNTTGNNNTVSITQSD